MTNDLAGSCLILSQDFLFGSRLSEAISDRGYEVSMQGSLESSVASTTEPSWSLIIVDLTLKTITIEDVVAWQQSLTPPPPLLAFGPHVQTGQLERARQAACEFVLTRGQLDQQLEQLLDEILAR